MYAIRSYYAIIMTNNFFLPFPSSCGSASTAIIVSIFLFFNYYFLIELSVIADSIALWRHIQIKFHVGIKVFFTLRGVTARRLSTRSISTGSVSLLLAWVLLLNRITSYNVCYTKLLRVGNNYIRLRDFRHHPSLGGFTLQHTNSRNNFV